MAEGRPPTRQPTPAKPASEHVANQRECWPWSAGFWKPCLVTRGWCQRHQRTQGNKEPKVMQFGGGHVGGAKVMPIPVTNPKCQESTPPTPKEWKPHSGKARAQRNELGHGPCSEVNGRARCARGQTAGAEKLNHFSRDFICAINCAPEF